MSIIYNGKPVLAIYRNGTAIEQALIAWNWTPMQLYFGGVKGAAYVPDVGEVYGLNGLAVFNENISAVLDEKNGTPVLGPNLIINGNFSNGITSWAVNDPAAATISVVDGRVKVNPLDTLSRWTWQSFPTVTGKTYELSLTYDSGTASSITFFAGSVLGSSNQYPNTSRTGAGTTKVLFVALSTTSWIGLGPSSNNAGKESFFDDISVREYSGNPSIQNSIAPRPLLGRAPASRRNLLTYSEQFDNAVWSTKIGVTIMATTDTPSPSITALVLTETAATSSPRINQTYAYTSGVQYTQSVRAKYSGRHLQLSPPSASVSGGFANFDLQTGVKGSFGGTGLTSNIINLDNGWYLCSITYTSASTISATPTYSLVTSPTSPRLEAYLGDETSGVKLAGAQLEVGSIATSYQKVVAATDITESGVTSYPFIRMDLSDDTLTTNLGSTKNLLRYTEEFNNAAWIKAGTRVTGQNVIETATTGAHIVYQASLALTSATLFVDAKANGRDWLRIGLRSGNQGKSAYFNISASNPAVGSVSLGLTSSIQSLGGGVYRCIVSGPTDANSSGLQIGPTTGDGVTSHTGDDVSGVILERVQLEAGSAATTYEYGGLKEVTAIVAGRNGTAVENITLPDGNFSLGPTTYTGGTPGILRAVGDIVGYNLINKTLTDKERKYLIEYYKDRGAKGALTYGPELITNGGPFINETGWALVNANISIENTWLRATATSTAQPILSFAVATQVGKAYRLTGEWRSSASSTWRIVVGNAAGGNQITSVTATQSGRTDDIFLAPTTLTYVSLRGVTGMATGIWGELNNMSVKELRPEEEWV